MTLMTVPHMSNALTVATTPAQTRKIEAASKAAAAWAEENNDYELFMQTWRVYLLARRKTTELVKADLDRNINVTAEQYGFTKMQWSRRLKELAVEQEAIDTYFDKLVSNGWQPSIAGMLRDSAGQDIDRYARAVGDVRRGANALLDEHAHRLGDGLRRLLSSVLELLEA